MKIPKSILVCWVMIATQQGASACPFCSATSQTLSEELAAAEVAVIAKLIEAAPEFSPDDETAPGADTGLATFAIQEVVRGADQVAELKEIKVVYFGSGEDDKSFLINGLSGGSTSADDPARRIDWTTPLPLSPRAVDYVKQLGTLPEKGIERLAFFMGYFEDEDPLLAQDAYDEFARAPYDEIIELADRMNRVRLMEWIDNPEVGPTRRRLYLTLLGVCGAPEDADKLESLLLYDYQAIKPGIAALVAVMGQYAPPIAAPLVDELVRADVRRKQQCLDALVAAYLKLKGPSGLPLIEERYLTNPAAEYTHVYATIMALRFHGEETDVLPRERLLESMRLLLDNEDVADQVIPDLARWEDWSILDRLVTMFKDAEEDAWIRQPVISYLLTAAEQPGDVGGRATTALEELEAIDPKTVKRARSYMAFGLLARPSAKKPAEPTEDAAEGTASVEPAEPKTAMTAKAAENPTPIEPDEASSGAPPSTLMIVGVPVIAGLLLMAMFALLLRGADVRSYGDGA